MQKNTKFLHLVGPKTTTKTTTTTTTTNKQTNRFGKANEIFVLINFPDVDCNVFKGLHIKYKKFSYLSFVLVPTIYLHQHLDLCCVTVYI